ncbi:MAG: hypothetical protein LBU67_00645 [Oscillospiraceae bacterium]|jgi:hypothetical protein|nr:hypothetical protein [Oscillospiraceae bacterium]
MDMRDVPASALWVRKLRGQRILASDTEPCDPAAPMDALAEVCRRLDVPRPLWLAKNQKEYDAFGRTAFTQDYFVEPIAFTRLEMELIQPEGEKKARPRMPLMDA